MNLNELCTVVSQDLPITVVILDNNVLGMVRQWQGIFYSGRYSQTTLNRKTNFAALADAFGSKQQTIRKIVLPTTILQTNGALNALSVLETVVILNGVEDISGWSLGQSRSLKEIYIPASVKKIGTVPSKYGKYTGLYVNERFTVDPNNKEYSDIDGVLYSKDLTILYRVPYMRDNQVFTVPDSVKQIESGAFSGNSTITEIKLPSTVESIGSAAFSDCSELTKISLSNISTICDSTFSGCDKLKRIKLPSTVESIGRNAFTGCSELVAINLEEVKV